MKGEGSCYRLSCNDARCITAASVTHTTVLKDAPIAGVVGHTLAAAIKSTAVVEVEGLADDEFVRFTGANGKWHRQASCQSSACKDSRHTDLKVSQRSR